MPFIRRFVTVTTNQGLFRNRRTCENDGRATARRSGRTAGNPAQALLPLSRRTGMIGSDDGSVRLLALGSGCRSRDGHDRLRRKIHTHTVNALYRDRRAESGRYAV